MKNIFFIYLIFPFFNIMAQDNIFNYPLRPDTQDSFISAFSLLAHHPIIKGKFEQEKKIERLDRSFKSSGNFIIAAQNGMIWETLSPFPSTMVLGSDYIIHLRPGGSRELLHANGNETFISIADVLSAVFSGRINVLLDNFNIFFTGNSSGWELGLIPLDRTISLFASRIIMKGESAIKQIIIREQNGDSIIYNLSNHIYPLELTANEISYFTKP